MENQNTEAIVGACRLLYKHMNPLLDIIENAEQYIPLYCYTATSSYALGLTKSERQNIIQSLRKLFDFFYELTLDHNGKYHSDWNRFADLYPDICHISSIKSHREKVSNFTEGNTFVCIGSPDGYYFDSKVKGLEFGEITYVIYGMYSFLKEFTDYEQLFNSELQKASDLYESIICNPANRRIYLRMRLKKTDIAYLSDTINEKNIATIEKIDKKVGFLCDVSIPSRDPFLCSAAVCSAMLSADFQFAKPLGKCKYDLCEGVEEIKDIIFEREMASAFVKLKRILE